MLISSRHVLTAAHCLFENYSGDAVLNKCGDRRLRWDQWFALFGNDCAESAFCKRRWYRISKIYYHEEYDPCTFDNDLALFVLSSDVPEDTATPICIPNRFEEINRNLTAAGDGAAVADSLYSTRPHALPVRLVAAVSKHILTVTVEGGGLCDGDSGGPLFQTMSDRNVLVGIMSRGISCEYENAADLFTDIRFYTRWTCEKSGVCTENY